MKTKQEIQEALDLYITQYWSTTHGPKWEVIILAILASLAWVLDTDVRDKNNELVTVEDNPLTTDLIKFKADRDNPHVVITP